LGAAILLSISDELHTRITAGVLRKYYLMLGAYLRVRHSALFVWWVHETLEFVFHVAVLWIALPLPMALTAAVIHYALDLFHEAMLGTFKNELEHRIFHFSVECLALYAIWG